MRLGIFSTILSNEPLEQAVEYFASLGATAVELGCGGFPGKAHCDPEKLLDDAAARDKLLKMLDRNGMMISALSAHGNPVHPNKETAAGYVGNYREAVLLAEKLGVKVVVTFSGCPGDWEGAKYPNWVTCPWPEDYLEVLKYQWDEVLIPYWKEAAAFAKQHGVKVALEMHPGFCVYSPETMMRLREAVGDTVGANLDPSHLVWQGVDVPTAIRYLGDAIHYFHAKDTLIDAANTARTGVLDTKHYGDEINRSWVFRSVGYGHDMQTWRNIFSALRLVGYDYVASVEHEDSLMTPKEGLEKAMYFLKQAMLFEPKPTTMSWA